MPSKPGNVNRTRVAGRVTLDGKPLPIANHSRDPQAGYGRSIGGKAKGYKLHVLIDLEWKAGKRRPGHLLGKPCARCPPSRRPASHFARAREG
jgi:hypothetical protein